ncbi:MAG: peptide chain release factor N(5)-glutamine methyltransferase, partial [Anaerolineales bacterium]
SELDVTVLAAHLLGRSRAWVLSHGDYELTAEQLQSLTENIALYREGVPLPYLLGEWEFFGNKFIVTEATLIPRPETELMVEEVLAWLESHPQAEAALDIGTGTGCVAISIALACERVRVVASDLSLPALTVAKRNVAKYNLQERITLICASLLPPLSRRFDVLCANLPYIPSQRLRALPIYGKEPTLALDGGSDGLDLYRGLLPALAAIVREDCLIACEIDSSQSLAMLAMARRIFPQAVVSVIKDLNGQDRLLKVVIESQ